jgi:hypothetical protein
LLPAFEFVARELGFLFVGAEVKEHIRMSHKISLRRRRWQVKTGGERSSLSASAFCGKREAKLGQELHLRRPANSAAIGSVQVE